MHLIIRLITTLEQLITHQSLVEIEVRSKLFPHLVSTFS
jgi:hypothetical protein